MGKPIYDAVGEIAFYLSKLVWDELMLYVVCIGFRTCNWAEFSSIRGGFVEHIR